MESPPLLSSEWFNNVVSNVFDQTVEILDNIMNRMVISGYLPLEQPLTTDIFKRMTDEQFASIIQASETPQEKEGIINMQQRIDQGS